MGDVTGFVIPQHHMVTVGTIRREAPVGRLDHSYGRWRVEPGDRAALLPGTLFPGSARFSPVSTGVRAGIRGGPVFAS